jgi:hypothetical protein
VSEAWLTDLRHLLLVGFLATSALWFILRAEDRRNAPPKARKWNPEDYCPVGRRQSAECPHCKE